MQWILSASFLTFGGFLGLGGRLVDLFGIRRIFLAGSALFGVGLLPGILGGMLLPIIVGRVLAGLGGALLNPASMGVIVERSPAGTPRDRAFGLFSVGQSIGFFAAWLRAACCFPNPAGMRPFVLDYLISESCAGVACTSKAGKHRHRS